MSQPTHTLTLTPQEISELAASLGDLQRQRLASGSQLSPGALKTLTQLEIIQAEARAKQREAQQQLGRGIPWQTCDTMPPTQLLPNGDSPIVLARYRPGLLDESLVPYMVCNTLWFNANWKTQGFSHWMLITPPKEPRPERTIRWLI